MGRPETVTRAATYLRVSSTDRQDLEVQLAEIQEHAERHGWELVATYRDIASGAREDRADFRRLLADAAKRKFDLVVVQRFDRAARSVKQLVEVLEHLRRCRVAFVSIKEDVDTSTPAGELIFHVMVAIGQFERALIADRIRAGLRRARALGTRVGRPPALVTPDQVLALRGTGLGYREIGRRLHISSALAHRRAREASPEDRPGRSETSHAGFETGTGVVVRHEASHGTPAPFANSDGTR